MKALALSLCVAAFAAAPAFANETPRALAGGKVIGVEEAKQLLASKSATFVDTRSVMNFGKGHIPGAVTAAYKEESDKVEKFDASKDKFDFSKLPADKSAKVVFYSDGPTGWKSYKAAVLSIQGGYKSVYYLRGGFSEWSSAGQPVER